MNAIRETPLPRQTYLTAEHAAAEQDIADQFMQWGKANSLKIGTDQHDRQKSRIDRAIYRGDTITGFMEVKTCGRPFGVGDGWSVSEKKVLIARDLYEIVRVPVLLVVRFADGTIASVDANEPYTRAPDFGRNDRGDPADREIGAKFEYQQLKPIRTHDDHHHH